MYLSRLRLELRSRDARRDLANPYDMHRTLARAFAQDTTSAPPRFLWRTETTASQDATIVLVQSAHAPDWTKIEAMPGYLERNVECKTFQPEDLLQPDARYRFRLCANPTVTRNGKRFGLPSEPAQREWLVRQGERHGFSVQAETVLVPASGILQGHKENRHIHLQRVLFEGLLGVVDVEKLTRSLYCGIGPGKAFGCGLLSLARIPRRGGIA